MKTVNDAADEYVRGMMNKSPTARLAFLAGAEWMRKQFGACAGTTDCIEPDCFNGRASFYTILDGRCIECAHKRMHAEGEHADG